MLPDVADSRSAETNVDASDKLVFVGCYQEEWVKSTIQMPFQLSFCVSGGGTPRKGTNPMLRSSI